MSVALHELQARGMTFRCRQAGRTGEPVVLLHGFPETSHMWVELMGALSEAGYRCLAPDQRGYSPGARPLDPADYVLSELAADVLALADTAGFERFHLIGHDWGAGAGWAVVGVAPERVLSWTALSVPHVVAFRNRILNDPDQQERSGYMNLFRQKGTAEQALSQNDFAALRNIWSASSAEQLEDYLSVLSQPDALTGALNWYRAAGGFASEQRSMELGPIDVPTLFIWGSGDPAIGRSAAEDCAQHMKGPYSFVELDAGHWLIQEAFPRVSSEILAHLRKHEAS